MARTDASDAVFLSYRRADTAGHAGRLWHRLQAAYGPAAVFYDQSTIRPGEAFPGRIAEALARARAVLVLVGPDWVELLRQRAARDEVDHVRRELELALDRLAEAEPPLVVPVLLGGARLPLAPDADGPLAALLQRLLTQRHAVTLHDDPHGWDAGFGQLCTALDGLPGMPARRSDGPVPAVRPWLAGGLPRPARHHDPGDARFERVRFAFDECARAAPGEPARVALCGMGGVGKTQLALCHALRSTEHYAGVCCLRATSAETLQTDAQAACAAVGIEIDAGRAPLQALLAWLDGQTDPWLLVYDDAEHPETLEPQLPPRGPHAVLITSRHPHWGALAEVVDLTAWTADEGSGYLARRLRRLDPDRHAAGFAALAEALGGLPLALAQAAAHLETHRETPAHYLQLLQQPALAGRLLDRGAGSVAATLALAFEKLSPAARALASLLAWCGPAAVPESMLRQPDRLPPALAAPAGDDWAWNDVVAELGNEALAERLHAGEDDGTAGGTRLLWMHRLTQDTARRRLDGPQAGATAAEVLLAGALPTDPYLPANWPLYAALLPHVDALREPSHPPAPDPAARGWLLDRAATYVQARLALHDRAAELFEAALALKRAALGDDHRETRATQHNLASLWSGLGQPDRALPLQQSLLDAMRRTDGADHPDTLSVEANLAVTLWTLGRTEAAASALERVLAGRRRTLGDLHPHTLQSLHNLATARASAGDHAAADAMRREVVEGRSRVLGPDHPDTLASKTQWAITLADRGRGITLLEEVLAAQRRVLVDRHPSTLTTLRALAALCEQAGDHARADALRAEAEAGGGP